MTRRERITGKMISVALVAAIMGVATVTTTVLSLPATAQQAVRPDGEQLRAGRNFMETKVYSQQDDLALLELFDGLRVADVSDGMDKVGLANVGLMSPEIQAAWKDTKHYKHRFIGIAVTVRYVPSNRGFAPRWNPEHSMNGWARPTAR